MVLLVDTHCHLNFDSFDQDRAEVVERSRYAGIQRILNPGIDLTTSREALALADEFSEVYAAVGVHPNESQSWDASTYKQLKELARHPKAVAIGEIGLDYYRNRSPHEVQRAVFRQQLDLAGEVGLPVVIHTRSESSGNHLAMEEALELLAEWMNGRERENRAERPGVFHSYSGNPENARRAMHLGFWIGITGPVTFKNAALTHELVASLPLERVLVETDAPFLTPHPHRGKRNEPAYVRLVAEQVARIHSKSFEEVANTCTESATRLFQW